jgi:hypothetical protein
VPVSMQDYEAARETLEAVVTRRTIEARSRRSDIRCNSSPGINAENQEVMLWKLETMMFLTPPPFF